MNTIVLDLMEDHMGNEDFDWGDDASTFGDRLARARDHADMTQAELARRLGVKHVTIRNWESDRSEPRANRLQMLSGLLGVSIIWLMTGEGEGAPSQVEQVAPASGEMSTDLKDMLAELRDIRVAQTKLADRAGRLEKRLRALAAAG